MKKASIWAAVIVVGIIAGLFIWYFSTASGQRAVKNWQSNNAGGIERVVKVYSDSGELLEQYEGKIDIQDTEYGNKILFDLDGKRIVIYNGTVIAEEQ